MVDPQRLQTAYQKALDDLLAERNSQGHWVGELSASALATATAISALALVDRHSKTSEGREKANLSELITGGVQWLAEHQNADGGWGDTDKSHSNISTSMLVVAAFHLADVSDKHAESLKRAESYIESKGGIPGLRRRYGRDKTFAVPILSNCALAGIVPWREVSPLPFELACLPQKFYRFVRLPVVSYAIPALVAIGQARYFFKKPWNPIMRFIRGISVNRSLQVLKKMQPASGGYLEATPLTCFVVMSLAATGRADHPVTQLGVSFLLSSMRSDFSWPIDTNLATWTTTLSLNACGNGGEDIAKMDCLDWLLSCQYTEVHPFTGASPGGWGWSDLSGAVPDADDTPGAMLALAAWNNSASCTSEQRDRLTPAAINGANWLFQLQNGDGGWPTFCRGWGILPFDRSGSDLTAHAIRALHAWQDKIPQDKAEKAIARGFRYLSRHQRDDGSWLPLWFGNQDHPEEENPVYGTAKVLLAYRDRNCLNTQEAQRGLKWLVEAQNEDGGWGGSKMSTNSGEPLYRSSVEETALALETLLGSENDESLQTAVDKGLEWIIEAVESGRNRENSPIGFYFAKLWYYERLYPMIFTVSALGRAVHNHHPQPTDTPQNK